jgi:hypothetical protein
MTGWEIEPIPTDFEDARHVAQLSIRLPSPRPFALGDDRALGGRDPDRKPGEVDPDAPLERRATEGAILAQDQTDLPA